MRRLPTSCAIIIDEHRGFGNRSPQIKEGCFMAYNKSDLVSKIAQKSNLTKAQAEAAVNAFQDVFVEAMQSGEGLKLTGLFSAERVKRAARTGRNPRTGEIIEIPATYGVRISAGSLLKKAVTE
jgi:DNA-binding protein HU-beta